MCKKMYNDLCEICQNAADCTVDYDGVTLDAITRNVVDRKNFKVVPKIKIKCTYECKELGKIAVVEKEVYKLPDLPWEDKTSKAKKKASTFKKPTADEINAYCAEKGYGNVDAEAFLDHYETVGWMVGKNPMVSWKKAVANWERTNRDKKKQQNDGIEITYENIEQLKEKYPDFDWDAYEEEDFNLRFMSGKLGRGVVLLSPVQEDLFLDITDDAQIFNYYIELLADFIIKKNPKLKSHFNTLMKWYKDNFRGFN